jgi:nitroreductase
MEPRDLRATIGGDMPDRWPPASQVLASLLAGRFSCRGYRSDAVPRDVIARMLDLAQLSASWCNSQPWQVIVTEAEGTERFREVLFSHAEADQMNNVTNQRFEPDFALPAAYRGIYKERQREVGWQLYGSVGVAYGDRVASSVQALKNFRLFDAPHALVVTSERDLGVYGAIDCGLYVQALLLAAESLGLGMIPQAALASYAPLIREHFAIPENRVIVLGCSFGYPDLNHPANNFRSRRAELDQIVQWVTE